MHNVTITTMRGLFASLFVATMLTFASAAQSAPRLAGLLDKLPQVSGPQNDLARPNNLSPPKISPAEAAQRARQKHGGKVLSVYLERNGARPQYRVKIIDNGNVRVVRVPAN